MNEQDKFIGLMTEPVLLYRRISEGEIKGSTIVMPLVWFLLMVIIFNCIVFNVVNIRLSYFQGMCDKSRFHIMNEQGLTVDEVNSKSLEAAEYFHHNYNYVYLVLYSLGDILRTILSTIGVLIIYLLLAKRKIHDVQDWKKASTLFFLPYYYAVVYMILIMISALISDTYLPGITPAILFDLGRDKIAGFGIADYYVYYYNILTVGIGLIQGIYLSLFVKGEIRYYNVAVYVLSSAALHVLLYNLSQFYSWVQTFLPLY